MTEPLTPEALAELRRLLDDMRRLALREGVYNGNRAVLNIIERVEPLLDAAADRITVPDADKWQRAAAAERDALAARLEGAEAVIEVQDVHARLVIAERDEAMRALGKLTAERDAEPDRIAELAAERDTLAAKVERVREWCDRRGVDVSDRDDDYMRGYRAAQRHALLDAAELRRALDGETDHG